MEEVELEAARETAPSQDGVAPEDKKDAAPLKVKANDAAESFRAARFAEKNILSWWFPQILDDEKKTGEYGSREEVGLS